MKTETRRIGAVLMILLLAVSISMVFASPLLDMTFYGYVTIDGLPAPDGILVEAKINGVVYQSQTIVDGQYGFVYGFIVPIDWPSTERIDGGVAGDDVDFYVYGFYATTFVYENGALRSVDLEITTTVHQIQLYEGWNLVGIPGIPVDPSIGVMLNSIIGHVESVWTYDGATGHWSSYVPEAPNDLSEMVEDKGYWINMSIDKVWEFEMI